MILFSPLINYINLCWINLEIFSFNSFRFYLIFWSHSDHFTISFKFRQRCLWLINVKILTSNRMMLRINCSILRFSSILTYLMPLLFPFITINRMIHRRHQTSNLTGPWTYTVLLNNRIIKTVMIILFKSNQFWLLFFKDIICSNRVWILLI